MKEFKQFSTPHCHVSSLDSASTPEAFIKRNVELGTGSITVTDHGYLGGCRDIYKLAKENGLSPILGIEAYHRSDDCEILTKHGIKDNLDPNTGKPYYKYGHLCIHCKDQKAYEALIRKVSLRDITAEQHGSERKPIFTWNDLEDLAAYNVTMTSGCLIGLVSRHIMADRPDIAVDYYKKIRSIVKPENFYVELFPNRCDKNWVSGVFFTLEDGTKLKYYADKKLKTDKFDEISASDLARQFKRNSDVGKLIAVKNYRTWNEYSASLKIINCEHIRDFVENECRPWCPDGDVQLGANKFLLELANIYGDKVILSDDSHYAYPEDSVVQDSKLGGMGDSFRFYGDYSLKTSQYAWEYCQKYLNWDEKQFEKVLDNNKEWSSNFKNFELKNEISLPKSFYPSDTLSHLKKLIDENGRMDYNNPKMVERLDKEIELLYKNGTIDLLPYFFLSQESVSIYEKNGDLPGPGRGSAGGVFIAYLLGVTHVDPLRYDLSLDRFMTLDRIKTGNYPDIDQDLPNRDLLISHLRERFKDNFAQISTANLLRLKSAIKDVARAKWDEVPYEIERLCSSIPNTPQGIEDLNFIFGYESDDGKEVEGLFDTHKGLQEYAQKYPDQWTTVQRALRIRRSHGRHASAYVIADKPIQEFIPLMTVNDVRVTQYTMGSCEASGALKMDYLVLNTLNDISKAINLIQQRSKITIENSHTINNKRVPKSRIIVKDNQLLDVYDLPDDQNVYNSICEGETVTVFQLSTPSAQKWLKEFNYSKGNLGHKLINSIEGISAFTALDRPGPLNAKVTANNRSRNMLQEYAARLRGLQAFDRIEYLTEKLPETQGVIVYQEQLTKVYRDLTGCDGIEAEKFRKMVGKKENDKLNKLYPDFIAKSSSKIGEEVSNKIWDQIVTFGQYGFNKCLDGNTILNTNNGLKQIKDVNIGDVVKAIDLNGNLIDSEIVKLYDNGEIDSYEIELDDGYKIICSINHKFLTKKGMLPLYEILETEEEILSYGEFNKNK